MNLIMESRITLDALGLGHLRDARPLRLIAVLPGVVCAPGECHPFQRVLVDGRRLELVPPFIAAEPARPLERPRRRLSKPGPY